MLLGSVGCHREASETLKVAILPGARVRFNVYDRENRLMLLANHKYTPYYLPGAMEGESGRGVVSKYGGVWLPWPSSR